MKNKIKMMDKICVSSYEDYDKIRRWSIIYCPKLLIYFIDITIKEDEFNKVKEEWVQIRKAKFRQDYNRLGRFNNREQAISNLRGYYRRTFSNVSLSDEQIEDETDIIIRRYEMSDEEIGNQFAYPIIENPGSLYSTLKWRCPISIIRKYLKIGSGWLYRLFWKGSRYYR